MAISNETYDSPQKLSRVKVCVTSNAKSTTSCGTAKLRNLELEAEKYFFCVMLHTHYI